MFELTPSAAVDQVRERFPFANYIVGDAQPWLTIGEVVQNYLEPGSKVLDFGSGPCDKTAVAALMGCSCTAYDDLGDDWHAKPGNVARIEDFADAMGIAFSREYAPPEPSSYDMVMMNDVLEHIHDSPRDLLNQLVNGLKEEGLLFITVPNLANIRKRLALLRGRTNLPNFDYYYWHPGTWRGPQREYVRNDLVALTRHLGLEIVELKAVHHMLKRLPSSTRPIYRAATRLFPDWRDTWRLIARKPVGWTPQEDRNAAKFRRTYRAVAKASLYDEESGEVAQVTSEKVTDR